MSLKNIGQILLNNITILQQKAKKTEKSKRNIINKWFQDIVKSYLMEKIAATLLKDCLGFESTKDVKNHINQNLSKRLPSYMGILLKYFELIEKYELQKKFLKNLTDQIQGFMQVITLQDDTDYNTDKKIRASFVSYLIYNYFGEYLKNKNVKEFKSFFQIWNLSFPDSQICQRRRNFSQIQEERTKKNLQQNICKPITEVETNQKQLGIELIQELNGQQETQFHKNNCLQQPFTINNGEEEDLFNYQSPNYFLNQQYDIVNEQFDIQQDMYIYQPYLNQVNSFGNNNNEIEDDIFQCISFPNNNNNFQHSLFEEQARI